MKFFILNFQVLFNWIIKNQPTYSRKINGECIHPNTTQINNNVFCKCLYFFVAIIFVAVVLAVLFIIYSTLPSVGVGAAPVSYGRFICALQRLKFIRCQFHKLQNVYRAILFFDLPTFVVQGIVSTFLSRDRVLNR